ncbi:MAG: PilZ domain-containing protein [Desulfobaccales bacterium]
MPCGPVCSLPQEMLTPPQEERRRFQRLRVSLPLTFRLQGADGQGPVQGRGVLRDVSLSGAYFLTDAPCTFSPDLMVELSILCHVPSLDRTHTQHLYARGRVVRLEDPQAPGGALGVAVTFLESPSFSPPPAAEMFKK